MPGLHVTPPPASGTSGRALAPNRTVFLGDSITIGDSGNAPQARSSRDPYAWAALFNPRIMYARNAGVPSNSAGDMLARFEADVAAHNPEVVIVNAGTNEAGASVALSTYAANVKALVDVIRGIGARPVLSTVLPHANTARQQFIDAYNAWLAVYCAREALPLLDYHRLLADATAGGLKATYDLDGIHPNAAGARQMGLLAAAELDAFYQPWGPPLASHQAAGSRNLVTGGLFLADTNADGLADGFAKTAAGTASRITGDNEILGNWQRLADSAVGNQFVATNPNIAAGWSIGDRVAVCGRMTIVNGTSVATTTCQLQFNGGTPNSNRPFNAWADDVTNVPWYAEDVIPAGTTSIGIYFARDVTTLGNGYAQIAQVTILNLTTLGVIAAL